MFNGSSNMVLSYHVICQHVFLVQNSHWPTLGHPFHSSQAQRLALTSNAFIPLVKKVRFDGSFNVNGLAVRLKRSYFRTTLSV